MTMTELLEGKKEQLLRQLETAGTPDHARPVVEAALDRLLYSYNESCSDERCREAASQMLRAARTAVPLVDSVGEVRVWEREAASDGKSRRGRKKEGGKGNILFLLFLILGVALAAAALALSLSGKPDLLRLTNVPFVILLLAGAMLSLYLSGRMRGGASKRTAKKQQMTECVVDADKIYRTLHAVTLVIDQELVQVEAASRWEKRTADAVKAGSLSEDDLAVYSGLLEAAYSGDRSYAIEKLNELRYYLHTKQIDVVDYSDDHAAWFDRMPSSEEGTLRPALVSNGKLLRKGMVSAGL